VFEPIETIDKANQSRIAAMRVDRELRLATVEL